MTLLEWILLVAFAVTFLSLWRERGARRASEARHREEMESESIRRAEQLRGQSERTAALFDRMVEGVIALDQTGRIRLANRAAGAMFNFNPPATGRTLLEATRNHEVAAVASRLDTEAEVLGHEIRIESSAAPRFLQVNALALRDGNGVRDGAILVLHDLTALRQAESLRQEFVGNVSHELRTPLSLIKSAAETLIDGAKDDPSALVRFLEIIDRHANRLTLLIDDLLLLSTLDSGRVRLELRPVPMRSVVQEAIDDLSNRARSRKMAMENAVPAGLTALGDATRLQQVLGNLLDNAVKYGRNEGKIRINAQLIGDKLVEVSVRDDGPGIPVEAQGRIFERFYRVDKARSREQGGTGLGLAIVKHVVQAHGGEVRVESVVGQGAVFFFTLPVAS